MARLRGLLYDVQGLNAFAGGRLLTGISKTSEVGIDNIIAAKQLSKKSWPSAATISRPYATIGPKNVDGMSFVNGAVITKIAIAWATPGKGVTGHTSGSIPDIAHVKFAISKGETLETATVVEEVLHSVYTAKNTFVEYTFDPELVVTNTENLYFSVSEVVWVNTKKAPKNPTIVVYYYG
jgi:hypothetical protein